MQRRVQVEVEGLQGERWRLQEEGLELRSEDAVLLTCSVSRASETWEVRLTLSIARMPLQRAWLTIPYSGALLYGISRTPER